MPGLKVAVANGNWSSTSTWNGGILPVAGDTVASNGFTVTIDQNVNVDSITNAAQTAVNAVPLMTSNTTPSGIATRSSVDNSGREAYNAFDGNTAGTWWSSLTGQALPQWIAYEFTSSKLITKYKFLSHTFIISNFTFEGWDGSAWVVLHTVTANAVATYTSPELTHTTFYAKYRINVTSVASSGTVNMYELYFFEKGYTLDAVSGGTFNLNSGVTVTTTYAPNGLYGNGTNTLLTYSAASGTSTINGSVVVVSANANTTAILHSGAGTLNVNGNISSYTSTATCSNSAIRVTGTGILNFTGNILSGTSGSTIVGCLSLFSAGTINMIGNIYCIGSNATLAAIVSGVNGVFNLTGDIYVVTGAGSPGWTYTSLSIQSLATVTITGNIYSEGATSTSLSHLPIYCTTAASITLIGNNYSSNSGSNIGAPIYLTGASYFNHLGTIVGNRSNAALYNLNASAINILTGPFVFSDTGINPLYLFRMHLRRTLNAYFEFRDNSTNGAVPPAAAAPATRLVSANTIVDAPAIANVRSGVTFALGTLTGTCVIPVASNVSKDTVYDNGTVGTAYLEGSQIAPEIWNKLTSDLTVSGSIGERLKNVATVQSTGQQIAAFKI
jgi:hypothetical protein